MKEDYLVIKDLTKEFGSGPQTFTAVDNVNVRVGEGELVTLLGPSGCGKTTTLRMIAGFEIPTSGDILIDGESVRTTPPNKRPTTMVFQNYALFPHMSVGENISYGLKIRGDPKRSIVERTEKVMKLVGLSGMANRSPAQLSGGQQQRVSLARSLIMEPKVLLLDEPLSNLDAKLRVSTRLEIRKLQQRIGITSVYVTHDQEEAMTLSDRVVIMHEGKIQQIGKPQEIYAHPVNRFVADFIGKANFLEGRVAGSPAEGYLDIEIVGKRIKVSLPPKSRAAKSRAESFPVGEKVLLVVRPESIELDVTKPGALIGKVQESVYLGSQMVYEVELGKTLLTVEVSSPQEHIGFSRDEEVSVWFKEKSVHILSLEGS
ncbi:MAG TPA: ABC transporter ATP-binding protein [Spirochaetia bacterium]|nr:ABC transporter ATP-binding protein [Spirochaetia bacterium]